MSDPASSRASTQATACGFGTHTGVADQAPRSVRTSGTASTVVARPIDTVTALSSTVAVRTPPRVSIGNVASVTRPASRSARAKSLAPFPHISATLPSALR